MANTQTAVAYIRVSTDRQATHGVSLEAQRDRIEQWCTANGYTLASVHCDSGISGTKATNRPALQAALTEVCAQRGALVVYSLSRLARSTMDAISISKRLEKAGADLVSLSEKLDTSGASGKLIFTVFSAVAQFESDTTSERTRTALAFKRSRGERCGQIPYGWNLSGDGVHLVRNEAEQQIIAAAKILRDGGLSLRKVASELEEQGLLPRTGGTWNPKVVRSLLNNSERKAA